jgi:trk system potassium uptake protein TrkH
MVLFGMNFNIFYFLIIREFKRAFKNEEIRLYFAILFTAILIISVNIFSIYGNAFDSIRHAFFQVSSIMTTTGFSTQDFNLWPELSRILLVFLMIIGACAGSTGGGIKVMRLLVAWKMMKNAVQKILHPQSVKVVQLENRTLNRETMDGVNAFLTAYTLIAVISMLFLAFENESLESTATALFACLNNIGPGLDIVGPVGNYAHFTWLSKLILSINMLVGRLEIFPIVLLFTPSVWKRVIHNNKNHEIV